MKKVKAILAICIVICLCCNLVIPTFAANTLGISYEATLDNANIQKSDVDQSVSMTIKSSQAITLESISATITASEPLEVSAIESADSQFSLSGSVDLNNRRISWDGDDNLTQFSNVTNLIKVTFKIPANTPAGQYSVGVENLILTKDYGEKWETGATATATLTITDGNEDPDPTPTTESYTADLGLPTGASNAVKVGNPVSVTVLVGGTTKAFASSELNLTYTGLTYTGYTAAKNDGQIDVAANNGAIKIIDHGESSTWSDNGTVTAYTLNFTVDSISGASGSASVTLSNAALSTDENASGQNLTSATVTNGTQTFTVTPADLTVTLPEDLTSTGIDNKVSYNGTFEFEATDKHYTYTLSAKDASGNNVTISNVSDGKWKIENVTSNIEVTVTNKVAKTYTISFSNKDHIQNQTTDSVSFEYGKEGGFSFVLKDNVPASTTAGTTYAVDSIKYTGTENNVEHNAPDTNATTNRTYVIPTASITGDITITTSAEKVNPNQFTITLPTSTYPELIVDKTVVDNGGSVVLTLDPVAGYKYTVSVNGTAISDEEWTETEATDDDKLTYTITNITENMTVTVTMEVDTSQFTVVVVNKYVAMNGKTVHLVRVSATLDSGYDCTYDGDKMYWSTGYAAAGEYVYLVITDANTNLTEDDVKAKIGLTTEGKLNTIAYDGNVNLADASTIDANDAQLVWNMYQAKTYTEFATEATGATMEKFLRADMDKDGMVDTDDAYAIVQRIKGGTN